MAKDVAERLSMMFLGATLGLLVGGILMVDNLAGILLAVMFLCQIAFVILNWKSK